jgi:hypothetical protein
VEGERNENENLEVMRNAPSEAVPDPLGAVHEKLDRLLADVAALRAEVARLQR